MGKFSVLFALVALCLIGSVFSVEEKVEHGSHGAEKHKPWHFKHGKHNSVYDYEALMGSRDHEELAELPEDVRRVRLTTLAKSHDINKNNQIETEEMFQWVLHSFRMLDHLEAEERRRDLDGDNDGKISFHDILKNQYGYSAEEIEQYDKSGQFPKAENDEETMSMLDEDKQRFLFADLDKDGVLDENEFIAFVHPYDFAHMHDLEVKKSVKEMDKDHDNFVSLEEFLKVVADDEDSKPVEAANFEKFDKDKDGKLSPDELKPWAIFDNKQSAQEETDHLMAECDENQDGHLSIEEIVDKEEDFISSQATDYGRHLHFVREDL